MQCVTPRFVYPIVTEVDDDMETWMNLVNDQQYRVDANRYL